MISQRWDFLFELDILDLTVCLKDSGAEYTKRSWESSCTLILSSLDQLPKKEQSRKCEIKDLLLFCA